MNPETRTLRWSKGILKFPCGVTVEITDEKIKWLFEMFKYKANGIEIVEKGKTTIPKSTAFHIKGHLT